MRKIGSGSFGDIYLVTDNETGKEYAMKKESKRMKQPQLRYEAKAYKALAGGGGNASLYSFHTCTFMYIQTHRRYKSLRRILFTHTRTHK